MNLIKRNVKQSRDLNDKWCYKHENNQFLLKIKSYSMDKIAKHSIRNQL